MSSYLQIKKNGVLMGEWSSNHPMYNVINFHMSTELSFEPEIVFRNGKERFNQEINEYKDLIKLYNKLLEGNISYTERYDTISKIQEYENEIEFCIECKHYIEFMLDSYNVSKDIEDENKWTAIIV